MKMRIKQNNNISDKIIKITLISISLLLLAYSGYRSYHLSFTIDESQTCNDFVPLSFMQIVSYNQELSANNHILNTLLVKLFSSLFGFSEFVLRAPNFIACIIYLLFSYLISKQVNNLLGVICCFIFLTANPYLLDFFSLCRGYALATSTMLASVYFLLEYNKNYIRSNLFYAYLFASLAVLSNFSLLIYFASLLIVTALIFFCKNDSPFSLKVIFSEFLIPILTTLILTVILYEPIRKLIKFNGLYFGGEVGFKHDTITSIAQTSLYGQPYATCLLSFVSNLILFITVFSFGIILWKTLTTKKINLNFFSLSFLLIVLPALVSITQHYLIGSKFLTDRMALFFIPLFMLHLSSIITSIKRSLVRYSLSILLALLLVGHTVRSANFNYYLSWHFDCQTKEMLNDLKSFSLQDNISTMKLGIDPLYAQTIRFYKRTQKLYWLSEVDSYILKPHECNYYYIMNEDNLFIKNHEKKIIKQYSTSGSYLLKELLISKTH